MYRTQAERLRLSADARIGPQVSLAASFEERVAAASGEVGTDRENRLACSKRFCWLTTVPRRNLSGDTVDARRFAKLARECL